MDRVLCWIENHIYKFVFIVFITRLLYVIWVPEQFSLSGDAETYDTLGYNLSIGNGFSQDYHAPYELFTRRPPLYPIFLSAIYLLFGHNIFILKVIQALLSALVCLYMFKIGELIFNKKIGALAALLGGIYPAFFAYSSLLLTETLSAFLFTLTIYYFILFKKDMQTKYLILTGLFLGLSSLCRAEMLYFIFFILTGIFIGNTIYTAIKRSAVIFVIMLLTILPWTIRNFMVTGEIIPVANAEGGALWIATYPELILEQGDNRRYKNNDFLAIEKIVQERGLSTVERTRLFRREAFKNLQRYPFAFVKNSTKRFFLFWIGSHSHNFPALEESILSSLNNKNYIIFSIKFFLLFFNTVFIAFAGVGLISQFEKWKILFPLLSIILYKTIIHSTTVTGVRYQIPIIPFVLIFSSVGIIQTFLSHQGERMEVRGGFLSAG